MPIGKPDKKEGENGGDENKKRPVTPGEDEGSDQERVGRSKRKKQRV